MCGRRCRCDQSRSQAESRRTVQPAPIYPLPRFNAVEGLCIDCNTSEMACQAAREYDRRKCCGICEHPTY